ncbi:MAG: YdbL family protein [Desulfacinum sp.]|nr:YdbL family protein [Desulfacinum sp.]
MKGSFMGKLAVGFLVLFLVSCVTINIYFPAEEVRKAAEDIVGDIRKEPAEQPPPAPSGDKQGMVPRIIRFCLVVPNAFAAQEVQVSNAAIRELKSRLARSDAQLAPYFAQGVLGEGADGYVVLLHPERLSIKDRARVTRLVQSVNADRKALYAEVARALKVDPGQIPRIAQVFAEEWQRTAHSGWMIQRPDGSWQKK